jgi:transcriptional regulator with XRE-family HTH domain
VLPFNRLYTADMAGRPPLKDAPEFGQRLAHFRKDRGYSQEALAQLLGTTRNNIAYYERKAKNPTLEFIQRCAVVLEVSVADLIGAEAAKAAAKPPGPPSYLQKQMDQVSLLPPAKRRFVSEFLDTVLKQAS